MKWLLFNKRDLRLVVLKGDDYPVIVALNRLLGKHLSSDVAQGLESLKFRLDAVRNVWHRPLDGISFEQVERVFPDVSMVDMPVDAVSPVAKLSSAVNTFKAAQKNNARTENSAVPVIHDSEEKSNDRLERSSGGRTGNNDGAAVVDAGHPDSGGNGDMGEEGAETLDQRSGDLRSLPSVDEPGRAFENAASDRGQDAGERGVPSTTDSGNSPGEGGLELHGAGEGGGENSGSSAEYAREDFLQHDPYNGHDRGRLNFFIESDDLPASPKVRAETNYDILRLLFSLEMEPRELTDGDLALLSRYSAFGGLGTDGVTTTLKSMVSAGEIPADWLDEIRGGQLNAYYTPIDGCRKIWNLLLEKGFNGGKVLDCSAGTGRFIGTLPAELRGKVKFTAVEPERISSACLRHLYPEVDLRVSGIEKAFLKDDSFDLVVSNVPFGEYSVFDREFPDSDWQIHDYFFAKTLKKVRPGGVIALLTSTGTLDKKSDGLRKYLADHADFMGAMRLPEGYFSKDAGTAVASDLIVLRKRLPGADQAGVPFVELVASEGKAGRALPSMHGRPSIYPGDIIDVALNEYFAANHELAYSSRRADLNRYGKFEFRSGASDNKENSRLVDERFAALSKLMPGEIFQAWSQPKELDEPEILRRSDKVKDGERPKVGSIFFDGGEFRQVEDIYPELNEEGLLTGKMVVVSASYPVKVGDRDRDRDRMIGMLELKEHIKSMIAYQQQDDAVEQEVEQQIGKLNTLYDAFVGKFKPLSTRYNRSKIKDDIEAPYLWGAEIWDEENKVAEKADIFRQRVIKPRVPVDKPETFHEAAVLSFSNYGKIVPAVVEGYLGRPFTELLQENRDVLFKHHYTDEWMLRAAYLSGNVRSRLREVERLLEQNPKLQDNFDALSAVLPKDISIENIEAGFGSMWVPSEYYREYFCALIGADIGSGVEIRSLPVLGQWSVQVDDGFINSYETEFNELFGTPDRSYNKLFDCALNFKKPIAYVKCNDGSRRQDSVLTARNMDIVSRISGSFNDWLWADPERARRLCRLYNEKFNSFHFEDYDATGYQFHGMSDLWAPEPHQSSFVLRALIEGNTLNAHTVGAGKTMQMAMLAMEKKRLGLASKAAIAVPNHLLLQTAARILQYYPSANIAVITKEDLAKNKRQQFMAKIAMNDWDAVILTHSVLDKLSVPEEVVTRVDSESIERLRASLNAEEAIGKRSRGSKSYLAAIERKKKALERAKYERERVQDKVLTFADLGIDDLLVDEAQEYKNLAVETTLTLPGIQTSASKKADKLLYKTRYLMELHGGEMGVTMFTGTPITNTVCELFNLHTYLRPSIYDGMGIDNFNTWAATFGKVSTELEMLPEGKGYRLHSRLCEFYNFPEMVSMFRTFADIKTKEELNLPTPEYELVNVVAPKCESQALMADALAARAKKVRGGVVKPEEDNLLKISSDGRKAALDMRLIHPAIPNHPESKLHLCANEVARIYHETASNKGTQLVFCDLGTPGSGKHYSAYESLRALLVERGVDDDHIVFSQDFKTDKRKAVFQDGLRSGRYRVAIGSTAQMGTGMDAPDRMCASHDLDPPWRPDQLEQRMGRIVRRGNTWEKVYIYRYSTSDSFDIYMYDTLRRKARMIQQAMSNPSKGPRCVSESSEMSYSEIVAVTTGNPLIKEKIAVDAELMRLERAYAAFRAGEQAVEKEVNRLPGKINAAQARFDDIRETVEALDRGRAACGRGYALELEGRIRGVQDGDTTWLDPAGAGLALASLGKEQMRRGVKHCIVARYLGVHVEFDLAFDFSYLGVERVVSIYGKTGHSMARRLRMLAEKGVFEGMAKAEAELVSLKQRRERMESAEPREFDRMERLADLRRRKAELDALVMTDEEDSDEDLSDLFFKSYINDLEDSMLDDDSAVLESSAPNQLQLVAI